MWGGGCTGWKAKVSRLHASALGALFSGTGTSSAPASSHRSPRWRFGCDGAREGGKRKGCALVLRQAGPKAALQSGSWKYSTNVQIQVPKTKRSNMSTAKLQPMGDRHTWEMVLDGEHGLISCGFCLISCPAPSPVSLLDCSVWL